MRLPDNPAKADGLPMLQPTDGFASRWPWFVGMADAARARVTLSTASTKIAHWSKVLIDRPADGGIGMRLHIAR
jgi:hypothetical protein